MKKKYRYDICIIGGLGHVGLPLGIVFANKNQQVVLHDVDKKNANIVFKEKKLPYVEHGASKLLKIALNKKKIHFSSDINIITQTPKIKNLKKKMIDNIAKLCEISKDQVNIKGKTTEKLGVVGEEKAIACEVICSVVKYD